MCKIYEIFGIHSILWHYDFGFLWKLHTHTLTLKSEITLCILNISPAPPPPQVQSRGRGSSLPFWFWASRSGSASPLNSPSDRPSPRRLCTWGEGGDKIPMISYVGKVQILNLFWTRLSWKVGKIIFHIMLVFYTLIVIVIGFML